MGRHGEPVATDEIMSALGAKHSMWHPAHDAPWTPLLPAEEWAKRLDRSQLVDRLWDERSDYLSINDAGVIIDIVIDAMLEPRISGK